MIPPDGTPGVLATAEPSGRTYTVIIEREDDGGFHAFCPTLKGCHTQGDTLDEVMANIREAIDVYRDSLRARGEPIAVEDILIKPVMV